MFVNKHTYSIMSTKVSIYKLRTFADFLFTETTKIITAVNTKSARGIAKGVNSGIVGEGVRDDVREELGVELGVGVKVAVGRGVDVGAGKEVPGENSSNT